jgi:hypothetical protein
MPTKKGPGRPPRSPKKRAYGDYLFKGQEKVTVYYYDDEDARGLYLCQSDIIGKSRDQRCVFAKQALINITSGGLPKGMHINDAAFSLNKVDVVNTMWKNDTAQKKCCTYICHINPKFAEWDNDGGVLLVTEDLTGRSVGEKRKNLGIMIQGRYNQYAAFPNAINR